MLYPESTIHCGRAARRPASIQRTLREGVISGEPSKHLAPRQRPDALLSFETVDPLAACAVELLAGRPPELARGAARAVEHRLAGLFLDGASGRLDDATRAALRRAAAREA